MKYDRFPHSFKLWENAYIRDTQPISAEYNFHDYKWLISFNLKYPVGREKPENFFEWRNDVMKIVVKDYFDNNILDGWQEG